MSLESHPHSIVYGAPLPKSDKIETVYRPKNLLMLLIVAFPLAAALTLDVTLISAVVGLLTFSVSTLWSFFQMKQKLEAQIEGMRLLVLKNKEDNIQLRKDAIYAVTELQTRIDEIEGFLTRGDQSLRFTRRSSSSQLTARDFLDYKNSNDD